MEVKKHWYAEFLIRREIIKILDRKKRLQDSGFASSTIEDSHSYLNSQIEDLEKALDIFDAKKEKRPFTTITKGTFEDLTDRIIETIIIPDPRSRGEIVSNERRKLELVLLDFLEKVRVEVEGG